VLILAALPATVRGQGGSTSATIAGRGIVTGIYSSGEPLGGDAFQVRLVQPMLMAHATAYNRALRVTSTINFEAWTIPDGELTIGGWGEGFVDRRHPHTVIHELMVSGVGHLGSTELSLSGGKGFAAFGSDDPSDRLTLRYPVNHHWSQILERAVLTGGILVGPVMAEVSLFNGDEPEYPQQSPNVDRFGDSWSARLTAFPVQGLQLEASYAAVHSPEHRAGSGTDQTKWHASAQWTRPLGGHPFYALAEWAETTEGDGLFRFDSFLAEMSWDLGPTRLYYQFESTKRPEEERIFAQPTRSVRPHLEDAILGTTQWTLNTVGIGRDLLADGGVARLRPFVEVSYVSVSAAGPGVFDPALWYDGTRFWGVSLGLTVGLGRTAFTHKMGRYGVSADAPPRVSTSHQH
jgi:hypothetical protein